MEIEGKRTGKGKEGEGTDGKHAAKVAQAQFHMFQMVPLTAQLSTTSIQPTPRPNSAVPEQQILGLIL